MKFKRIVVTLLAAVLALSVFAGCAKPETMATVTDTDGNAVGTVSFDQYLFWAYYNYAYYDAYYNNYYYYFQKYFKDTLDDIYDDTAENPITVNQFLSDSLVKDLKQQFVILKLFDEYGLTFGTDEITDVATYYSSMISNYGETTVKKIRARLGMNETQFKEMLRALVKITAVQEYLFGENGPQAVTEEDAKSYFLENYSRVKHIVVKASYTKKDEEGKDVTATRTEAEMQAIIDSAIAEYNANPTIDNFLTLVTKYSEDTGSMQTVTEGSTTTPDLDYCSASYSSSTGTLSVNEYGGYTYDTDNNSFYKEFTECAAGLKNGEIGSCKVTSQSTDGSITTMHVILKTDLSASEAAIKAALECKNDSDIPYINTIVENERFTTLIDAELEKLTFTFDETLLDKYSMKNLKSI